MSTTHTLIQTVSIHRLYNNITKMNFSQVLSRNTRNLRYFCTIKRPSAPSTASVKKDPLANVKGLSANVVKPSTGPVGPGAKADGEYKVPEYFNYNTMSYHEAEVEMAKFRIPQPSSLSK